MMKYYLMAVLLMAGHFRLHGQEQYLHLQQILDSVAQQHPLYANTQMGVPKSGILSEIFVEPTEIQYYNGKYMNTAQASAVYIGQSVGSPFRWYAAKKVSDAAQIEKNVNNILIQKQLLASAKQCYYAMLYQTECLRLLKDEYAAIARVRNALFTFFMSDTLALQKLETENSLDEVSANADATTNDIYMAQNNLMASAYLKIETYPADTVMEMYQLIKATDSITRTPGSLFKHIVEKKQALQQAKLTYESAGFFPTFKVGYYFKGNNKYGFAGWEIGATIPLVPFAQRSRYKQQRNELATANNELQATTNQLQTHATNYLTQLNNHFEHLNYFYNSALKQSDEMEALAMKMLENEHSDFSAALRIIKKAYDIRLQYFQTLYQYNKTAIEMELYAY